MTKTMSRPADWVDELYMRYLALTDAAFLRPLSASERLELQRVESLCDAYEAWDLGRCVTSLAFSLRHVVLGDEARERCQTVSP